MSKQAPSLLEALKAIIKIGEDAPIANLAVAAHEQQDAEKPIWTAAARKLGWRWSTSHDGYIHAQHRSGDTWADYEVQRDAESACWSSGAETIEEARAIIAKAEGR